MRYPFRPTATERRSEPSRSVAQPHGDDRDQAAYLDRARMTEEARAAILAELAWARAFAGDPPPITQPVCLTLTDTHPGNFVVSEGTSPRSLVRRS